MQWRKSGSTSAYKRDLKQRYRQVKGWRKGTKCTTHYPRFCLSTGGSWTWGSNRKSAGLDVNLLDWQCSHSGQTERVTQWMFQVGTLLQYLIPIMAGAQPSPFTGCRRPGIPESDVWGRTGVFRDGPPLVLLSVVVIPEDAPNNNHFSFLSHLNINVAYIWTHCSLP